MQLQGSKIQDHFMSEQNKKQEITQSTLDFVFCSETSGKQTADNVVLSFHILLFLPCSTLWTNKHTYVSFFQSHDFT